MIAYWLHNGSQVYHDQKRELFTNMKKGKKLERMLWYCVGLEVLI